MNDNNKLKIKQRIHNLKKRKIIFETNHNAYKKLFENFKDTTLFQKAKIIASYYSIKDEIQTIDFNNNIITSGKILCLPVVKADNNFLIFRKYTKDQKLVEGKYQIMEPDENSLAITPDLILAPCVAFDTFGYRLGYGGGY